MKVVLSYQTAIGMCVHVGHHSLPFGHANEQVLREACEVLAKVEIRAEKLEKVSRVAVYTHAIDFKP